MSRDWKKVENTPTWNGKDESGKFKLQPQDSLEGVYMGFKSNIGENNANIYEFKLPNGEMIGVWGSQILDTRLSPLQIGEEVKIVYLGLEQSKKVKGRSYHNFEVFHRMPEGGLPPQQELPTIQEGKTLKEQLEEGEATPPGNDTGEIDPKDIPFGN